MRFATLAGAAVAVLALAAVFAGAVDLAGCSLGLPVCTLGACAFGFGCAFALAGVTFVAGFATTLGLTKGFAGFPEALPDDLLAAAFFTAGLAARAADFPDAAIFLDAADLPALAPALACEFTSRLPRTATPTRTAAAALACYEVQLS